MTKLQEIFGEFAVQVPPDYDGACFRCGKPRSMRGDEDGLCIDCFDECTYMTVPGEGYEAGVRTELKKGRWYVQSGQNHWRGSLLTDIPPVMLKEMGVDTSVQRQPVSVFESINGPQEDREPPKGGDEPESAA